MHEARGVAGVKAEVPPPAQTFRRPLRLRKRHSHSARRQNRPDGNGPNILSDDHLWVRSTNSQGSSDQSSFPDHQGSWENYLVLPRNADVSFEDAVAGITRIAEELFGSLPIGSSQHAFFPPDLRNPILQAGHDITMSRVQYHGINRLVEPYSLKYKRRQDGVSREYLYVYDTTEGRASGPGLKSFVHSGFDTIENTDMPFQPRCEVELSKVGPAFRPDVLSWKPRSPTLCSPRLRHACHRMPRLRQAYSSGRATLRSSTHTKTSMGTTATQDLASSSGNDHKGLNMRLKKSFASATEELTRLVNEGYSVINRASEDYHRRQDRELSTRRERSRPTSSGRRNGGPRL